LTSSYSSPLPSASLDALAFEQELKKFAEDVDNADNNSNEEQLYEQVNEEQVNEEQSFITESLTIKSEETEPDVMKSLAVGTRDYSLDIVFTTDFAKMETTDLKDVFDSLRDACRSILRIYQPLVAEWIETLTAVKFEHNEEEVLNQVRNAKKRKKTNEKEPQKLTQREAERLRKLRDDNLQKVINLKTSMENVWIKAKRLKVIPEARQIDLAQRAIREFDHDNIKILQLTPVNLMKHNDFSKISFSKIDESLIEEPKFTKARAGHNFTGKTNKILPSYQEGGRKEVLSLKKIKKKRAKVPKSWKDPKENRKRFIVPRVDMPIK